MKVRKNANGNNTGGINLSYRQLGGIAVLIGILWTTYQFYDRIASKLATKSDMTTLANEFKVEVSNLAVEVKDHGARLREAERTIDRFFGAKPSGTLDEPSVRRMEFASWSEQPARRPVVPRWFAEKYRLLPAKERSGYIVYGEDGAPYNLDDVLGALIEAHRREGK